VLIFDVCVVYARDVAGASLIALAVPSYEVVVGTGGAEARGAPRFGFQTQGRGRGVVVSASKSVSREGCSLEGERVLTACARTCDARVLQVRRR
jgi:hypothetical protein